MVDSQLLTEALRQRPVLTNDTRVLLFFTSEINNGQFFEANLPFSDVAIKFCVELGDDSLTNDGSLEVEGRLSWNHSTTKYSLRSNSATFSKISIQSGRALVARAQDW